MKISIVTPCYNRHQYLDETVQSVVSQAGDFSIEYIVQNAGDDPTVLAILSKWEKDIQTGAFIPKCKNLSFTVVHEKDSGMYDGINRGFSRCTGEIMAWINTDDLYHPHAFSSVCAVFSDNPGIYWISGIANSFNAQSQRTGFDKSPPAYSRKFLQDGLYRIENLSHGFNWIPQDCVFWKSDLWRAAGSKVDTRYKYAADFYLWQQFAHHAELIKVETFLGGYRFHGDQVTADPQRYITELPPHQRPPRGWRRALKLFRHLPVATRLFFNPRQGKPFISWLGLNWHDLVGHSIRWDFSQNKWCMSLQPII